jgi:hypothetical protein
LRRDGGGWWEKGMINRDSASRRKVTRDRFIENDVPGKMVFSR